MGAEGPGFPGQVVRAPSTSTATGVHLRNLDQYGTEGKPALPQSSGLKLPHRVDWWLDTERGASPGPDVPAPLRTHHWNVLESKAPVNPLSPRKFYLLPRALPASDIKCLPGPFEILPMKGSGEV